MDEKACREVPKRPGLFDELLLPCKGIPFYVLTTAFIAVHIFLPWPQERPPRTITTAKGKISYEEIDAKVFRPNNYRMVEQTFPVPKLEYILKPSCEKTFIDWLAIAKASNPFGKPPRQFNKELENEFLLNGYTLRQEKYSDNRAVPKPVVWDQIEGWMKVPVKNLSSISHYGQDAMAVHYALQDYPVKDMTGMVIGSEKPWVEVMALRNGAKELWTVEYQETKVLGTDKILIFNPVEFAKNWKKNEGRLDFAISYSSIEHSGLGRYGDPIDPIGDLREIQKVACLLKRGAIFYLAFERGQDAILFNVHRVYGRMRLAMVMTGFEWLATYRGFSPYAVKVRRVDLEYTNDNSHPQDLFVLRKL